MVVNVDNQFPIILYHICTVRKYLANVKLKKHLYVKSETTQV